MCGSSSFVRTCILAGNDRCRCGLRPRSLLGVAVRSALSKLGALVEFLMGGKEHKSGFVRCFCVFCFGGDPIRVRTGADGSNSLRWDEDFALHTGDNGGDTGDISSSTTAPCVNFINSETVNSDDKLPLLPFLCLGPLDLFSIGGN